MKLKKDILTDFIKKLKTKYDDVLFKQLSNFFIGSLGKKYFVNDIGFITNSWDTVSASYYEHCLKNDDTKFSNTTKCGLHFVRITNKDRITTGDNCQLNRHILGGGMIQLMELISLVYDPKVTRVIGYNTDSVFVENGRKIDLEDKYKNEKWKPKNFKLKTVCDKNDRKKVIISR
jgi:hypothetical protein